MDLVGRGEAGNPMELGCGVEHRDRAWSQSKQRRPDQRPPHQWSAGIDEVDPARHPNPMAGPAVAVHLMACQAGRQRLRLCDHPVLPSRDPPKLVHRYTVYRVAVDGQPLWITQA